jgi:methanogenic corrinoid protein MtbC1
VSATDFALADAYTAYLDAVREGNRRLALNVVARAREAGHGVERIYLDVFQRTLREIGRLWQENAISVADEHLATAITQAAMARLYEQTFTGALDEGPTLIAACADIERHEVGLRMLCDLLELDGWQTSYLGASVPIDSLVALTRKRRPDVVALSASLAPHLPRLRAMITSIRDAMAEERPLIVVGGRPFVEDPSLAARVGADFTARDAAEAVELLRRHIEKAR